MNPETPEIRWHQRFQNFQRAFLLLRDAMERDRASLSQLEKEGIIQRFEYCFELAWNVLKDRMVFEGIVIDRISPKNVIKQAFAAKFIDDVACWLRMIEDRNLISHTYDFAKFELVIQAIGQDYLPLLEDWYLELLQEISQS
ncbi:MAG: nucleotidyltransferase substrate binding protein [Alphaproteobacteria bacterium]|nr:nucleotidyltransferase substrate binding protein [Alphaproteobacteria bacterium]